MSENDSGTEQGVEDAPLSWADLSEEVRDVVLSRLRYELGKLDVQIADQKVTSMLVRQGLGTAVQSIKDPEMLEGMAGVLGGVEASLSGMGMEKVILSRAILAAHERLARDDRPQDHNQLGTPSTAWNELCDELSLDPSTAMPEDVVEMVKRLKARNAPEPEQEAHAPA